MATALGDFLICLSQGAVTDLPEPAFHTAAWPHTGNADPQLRLLHPAAGVLVACSGDVRSAVRRPRGGLGLGRAPERGGAGAASERAVDAALEAWMRDPDWQPTAQRGRYVYAGWDADTRTLVAFTDSFRTYPVFYCAGEGMVLCASDLRLILATLRTPPEIDPVAIYHYLNFGYVPAPHSALLGVRKLEPGSRLSWQAGRTSVARVLEAGYPEDLGVGSDAERAGALRDRIVGTVTDHRPAATTPWGTCLSGGTDSSSISGILARADAGRTVDSFSIGFGEDAYDELAYARIAVRHFGLRAHEQVVDEADSVALIPRLVAGFDEPFGNPSAVASYYCAELGANAGKALLVAGDGGDEIFGGNERYAKDQVYRWYHRAPGPVRAAGRLLARALRPLDAHWSNRIKTIIHRGGLPNPDRFYQDDSFASDHFDHLLSGDFRGLIRRDDSLELEREIFARAGTASELHRLMYLDLKLTLAESDVVKVVRTARMAGIDVVFPFLDQDLVAYTGRLPARDKVRGLKKRYLFKQAMSEILPAEIINKKKQGFGLPVAVWMRQGGPFRDMLNDVLRSGRARARGYFEADFVESLMRRHEQGSWDHSVEMFRLLMLELWHREYLDGRR